MKVGLVEVADIARVVALDRALDRVSVYEVMTKPVVTIPSAMLARYATRLLASLNRSRAVVVDDVRNAVGMVTLRDLVLARTPGGLTAQAAADHWHRGQLLETMSSFDAEKRPGEKCGLGHLEV